MISKQPVEYMSANMPRHQILKVCELLKPRHWMQKDLPQCWPGRSHVGPQIGCRAKEALLIKWLFLLSTKCCQIGGKMRERPTGVAEILSQN